MTGLKRKRLLARLYQEEGRSIRQIADQLGQSSTTIHRWLDEAGIERREPGRRSQRPPCVRPYAVGLRPCRRA